MILVSTNEAQQRLPELLTAAGQGEVVRIQQNGTMFQLSAVPPQSERPRPPVTGVPKAGRLEGYYVVPDDFDEPLEELREYME
jgi:antitoxin (DNA-binding transcriptional repressor) of toxin-antitoxin stability system